MGAKVSNFVKDVAKTAAKAGTSWVLGKVPIIGTPVANYLNSQYKHGGLVNHGEFHLRADGGLVPPVAQGLPVKAMNSAKDLIAALKKFPEQAQKAGLSVEEVKAAASAPVQKKRGGRRKKSESDKGRKMKHVPAAFKKGGQLYEHKMKVLATPSIF